MRIFASIGRRIFNMVYILFGRMRVMKKDKNSNNSLITSIVCESRAGEELTKTCRKYNRVNSLYARSLNVLFNYNEIRFYIRNLINYVRTFFE